jgi:SAM-dependent methyltransferase
MKKIGSFHRRINCRICKGCNLKTFINFGDMPLAGNFVFESDVKDINYYPMDLSVCLDCSLVQILNVVDPETIFTDYRYLSSITNTLTAHFQNFAEYLHSNFLKNDSLLVEIGCNDGVLLKPLMTLGAKVVGVDAADNVIEIAREKGLDVIHGFFGLDISNRLKELHGKATVITASNVFAHIDDLDNVMQGVDNLLAEEGVFIVEVHYVLDLIKDFQFDTVYHEHLCYYSIHALRELYQRFGLSIIDVQHLPMHGGTIRVFACRIDSKTHNTNQVVQEMLDLEIEFGLLSKDVYVKFGIEVEDFRNRIIQFLNQRHTSGRSLCAYGAAGRATILLNFCDLNSSKIEYVVDESPFRVGRCVPGVNIPIVSRDYFFTNPTADCLITAWNYKDEILGKEKWHLDNGNEFIIPLPKINVISN